MLQLKEVRWASLHVDETLRMCALSLLCTDLKMTTVPPAAETDLLREVSVTRCWETLPAGSHNTTSSCWWHVVLQVLSSSISDDGSGMNSAILCWLSLFVRAAVVRFRLRTVRIGYGKPLIGCCRERGGDCQNTWAGILVGRVAYLILYSSCSYFFFCVSFVYFSFLSAWP